MWKEQGNSNVNIRSRPLKNDLFNMFIGTPNFNGDHIPTTNFLLSKRSRNSFTSNSSSNAIPLINFEH